MPEHLNWRQALLCNLGFACYCAGFVALVWPALDPNVLPRQAGHEGPQLEQTRNRILQGAEARLQLLDDLQSSQHQPVAFLQATGLAQIMSK